MTQKSYVINNFNKFAEDIRQAVAHAILKNSFPDQKNEVLDDLDSFITIYQVKEIIKNNALAVADDPVVDLKGMDNAWAQVNQGIFSAALSKLAASGDIEEVQRCVVAVGVNINTKNKVSYSQSVISFGF